MHHEEGLTRVLFIAHTKNRSSECFRDSYVYMAGLQRSPHTFYYLSSLRSHQLDIKNVTF